MFDISPTFQDEHVNKWFIVTVLEIFSSNLHVTALLNDVKFVIYNNVFIETP
jgi:hypothetical protein